MLAISMFIASLLARPMPVDTFWNKSAEFFIRSEPMSAACLSGERAFHALAFSP
jgi:hypothetical protein